MLTLRQTRVKTLFASLIAVFALSVLGSVIIPQGSAHAADYPKDWCTFTQSGDQKTLKADCKDDKDNGGFHEVTFTSSGKDAYSFTDSYWTYSNPSGGPSSSHYEPDLSGGGNYGSNTANEQKCAPAIIKITGNEAKPSGQYASYADNPDYTGYTSNQPAKRWQCTTLSEDKVAINRDAVKDNTWRDALYKNLLESIPPIECSQFRQGTQNYSRCNAGVAISIALCVGPDGSVWKDVTSGGKPAYKAAAVECLKPKLSRTSNQQITQAVNNAQQAADEKESEIVDIEGTASEEEEEAEYQPTCAVDGIGWIICPVMIFLADVNDKAFEFLSALLAIRPALVTDQKTIDAWSAFRDIANVAFVIAFMVIVYSQITSAGISNYGIKKLLPRIIIAAILVNLSYFVCAVMVDLSNIAGSSVYSLLKNLVGGEGVVGSDAGSTWSGIMGGLLAVGVGILLIVAIIMAPTVLLALAVVLLILIARQALVLILLIVSPLAFVAYLLPNTENWFKKWWKAFVATLMVYPIVGVVFGASTLASSILMGIAGDGGSGDDEQLLKIVALSVLAIPLFAVPAILKGSLSAAGTIGARVSGLADKTQGRATRKMSEQAKGYAGDAKNKWNMAAANGKLGLAGGLTRRGMRRDFLRASREQETKRATGVYTTGLLHGDSPEAQAFQRAAGGGIAGDGAASVRAAAFATQQEHKRFDEDVAAHKTRMTSLDHGDLMKIVKDTERSEEERAAAAGMISSKGYRDGHLELINYLTSDDAQGSALSGIQKQASHDMKSMPTLMGDTQRGQFERGELSVTPREGIDSAADELMLQRLEDGKMSEQSFASLDPDEVKIIERLHSQNKLTPEAQKTVGSVIDRLRQNPTAYQATKDAQRAIHDKIHPPTQPAASSGGGSGLITPGDSGYSRTGGGS